jgi:hypothetical protein
MEEGGNKSTVKESDATPACFVKNSEFGKRFSIFQHYILNFRSNGKNQGTFFTRLSGLQNGTGFSPILIGTGKMIEKTAYIQNSQSTQFLLFFGAYP